MKFRNAAAADAPLLCAMEGKPEFRAFVGRWSESEHLYALADPDAAYLIAEDDAGEIVGFAILLGLQSEHKSLELKRLVAATPGRGTGRALLHAAAERAFVQHLAHRLWLDVLTTNDRAQHVYHAFGFRTEGILRDAIYRDGEYHSLVVMSLLAEEYYATRPPASNP
jgi:RimJ/RimL family protein N-acetyltransferase